MKLRYIAGITLVLFIAAISFGTYYKASYKDYNTEKEPLNNFVIGLISDNMLDAQIENFNDKLDSSKIILAVKCEEGYLYRFGCNTQKVIVEHVFKDDKIVIGDEINIARDSSNIYNDTDLNIAGGGNANIDMGFTNQMVVGNIYLIFLDHRINTYDNEDIIYVTSEDYILAPIFCYSEIKNVPTVSIDEAGLFAFYTTVADNEFFLMSDEAVTKMADFKKELLAKYQY